MATRFWVGGTGTWDAATTTHWAASTGGAGGQSVPGSSDTVTFDGSSGGGTVTVNFGGTITVQTITCGAFTGTLDFATNNNSVTLSAVSTFSCNGAGTKTLNLGSGTFSLTNAGAVWNFSSTGLTFNAGTSTISFATVSGAGNRTFTGGGLTYNALSVGANAGGGALTIGGSNTFASLVIAAPNFLSIPQSGTQTITAAVSITGSSSSALFGIASSAIGTTATISSANNSSLSWIGIRDITFSGGGTNAATNSFNFGNNSGITITAPASGGGLLTLSGMTGGMRG